MPVPLINIIEVAQVVDMLDEVSSPSVVNRALEASGITRSLLTDFSGFIPYRLEAQVVEHVARAIGDPYLGARAAPEFDYSAYAAYARYVLSARDLGTALARGRKTFRLIQPGGEIVLKQADGHLLVGRRSRLGTAVGHHHLDDAALFIIIRVIRHFLGPQWRPAWVEATGKSDGRLPYLEDRIGAPVRGTSGIPMVALPEQALDAPNPHPPNPSDIVTLSDLPVLMGVNPPRTMADTVEQMIRTQMTIGEASEDKIAASLSLGRRTLQRALQGEGTSFRDIKARAIERRARTLLRETDLAVATIAQALGYEEPKSFQRAFRRQTGVSPSAYRAGRTDD